MWLVKYFKRPWPLRGRCHMLTVCCIMSTWHNSGTLRNNIMQFSNILAWGLSFSRSEI